MADERERFTESEDVQRGLREVGAEVAMGRPSLFVGRTPVGYCVIAGAAAMGATPVGRGHMVAVGINEAGLRALRQRIDSLLGERTAAPLPEGLIVS